MWVSKWEFAGGGEWIHLSLFCLSVQGSIKTLTLDNYLCLFISHSLGYFICLFLKEIWIPPCSSPMSSPNPYESILSIPAYCFFRTLPFLVCPIIYPSEQIISAHISKLMDGKLVLTHTLHPCGARGQQSET